MKYPKIQTLYDRDEKFKVDSTQLRCPEFSLITWWFITEKIDGTNVRIVRTTDGERVILGRTDKADWALRESPLKKKLDSMFPVELLNQVIDLGVEATLYGEGYGAGIQKGGRYRKDPSFRLFDVKIGEWWLNWEDVKDIADKLGIQTVPSYGVLYDKLPRTREDLERYTGPSLVSFQEGGDMLVFPEGIVARTDPLLFNRWGERIMWKLKFVDFA